MKKTIFLLVIATMLMMGACKKAPEKPTFEKYSNVVYELYPTSNVWNFIKLDTRNGKMWQVQYSIDKDENRGQVPLNETVLVGANEETNGRFKLQSTQNIYNFILLDQVSGKMWQVQWSLDGNNRLVIPIN
jgi:hypothetical protein